MNDEYVKEAVGRLIRVDSQNRAAVLLDVVRQADEETGRDLLAHWFNNCDALAPWTDGLRAEFERVGFVTDADEDDDPLELPATVYRGSWEDDDHDTALSWTLDQKVAKSFCLGLVSLRSRIILGMYREGVDAYVWQGTCTEAYGYLLGRSEHEVIAKTVIDVFPIGKLVTGKEAEEA